MSNFGLNPGVLARMFTTIPGGGQGMVEGGNINLFDRPDVANADGTHSSVRSMSFGDNEGREILVPTVSDDGRVMTDPEAISQYDRTGRNLGMFDSPQHATSYAIRLHNQQEALGKRRHENLRQVLPLLSHWWGQ